MRLHAPSLHRLMRTLASLGILTERDAQRFALTPLGRGAQDRRARLGAGDADRVRRHAFVARLGADRRTPSKRAEPALTRRTACPSSSICASIPGRSVPVQRGDGRLPRRRTPAVAAAYDFSGFRTIVDVGGATGNMLAAILSRHAGPRGVLFDRPHVVGDAPALLKAARRRRAGDDRGRQFLRDGPRWRRRLPAVAHHPRLERGRVPHDPGPLPQGDASPTAGC